MRQQGANEHRHRGAWADVRTITHTAHDGATLCWLQSPVDILQANSTRTSEHCLMLAIEYQEVVLS